MKMDNVYKNFIGNATRDLNIKEYFSQYKQLLDSSNYNDFSILDNVNVKKLEKNCSIKMLNNVDGIEDDEVHGGKELKSTDIQDDYNLETLQNLKKRLIELEKAGSKLEFKYQSELAVNHEPIKEGIEAIPQEDILIYIRVYNPFVCKNINPPKKRDKMNLCCVICVLGHQTLSDLRDSIPCLSDLSIVKECSNNPQEFFPTMNKDIYKSGFFCIENTFYNDMRDPNNLDYSLPIRQWAKDQEIGPFKTELMENTRLDSLTVKFGFPWIYRHQGNCEHLIVFSDARFVNHDDDLAIANYPRLSRIRPTKNQNCMMCCNTGSNWMISGGSRMPHDPCYLCKNCFLTYNYINNKKIGEFQAYHHPVYVDLWKISDKLTLKKEH